MTNELDPKWIAPVICAVFGALVPLAILFGHYAVKRTRQHTLEYLQNTVMRTTGKDIANVAAFEYVMQKYDLEYPRRENRPLFRDISFYFATAIIFVVISIAGLIWLTYHAQAGTPDQYRYILGGIQPYPLNSVEKQRYELHTGAIICFAFLGSYIWSIQYLVRRVANFDLSPMSFLRVTAQIVMAGAVAAVFRHFVSAAPEWSDQIQLLVAFLIGFFPNAGLDYLIRKVPKLHLKQPDPDAYKTFRSMPVEMIDGIDSQVAFRLAEREINDVENLATENPILLYTETPYSLLQVLDWIAQAQLALEVGPKAYLALRKLGIRTIFALEAAANDQQHTQTVLNILYENEKDRPPDLRQRSSIFKANLHVERLCELHEIVKFAMASDPGRSAWQSGDPGADKDGPVTGAATTEPVSQAKAREFEVQPVG